MLRSGGRSEEPVWTGWDEASDEELVDGLRSGLDGAWLELDRRYGPWYGRWAIAGFPWHLVGSLRDQVPGFLFSRLRSFSGEGSFRGWLRTVVRSASGQLLRDLACDELVMEPEALGDHAAEGGEGEPERRERGALWQGELERRLGRVENRLYVLIYRLLAFRLGPVRAPGRADVRATRRWALERARREPARAASWHGTAAALARLEDRRTLRALLRSPVRRAREEGLATAEVAALLQVDVQVVWQAKSRVRRSIGAE